MHQEHLIWPYKLIYLFVQKLRDVGVFYEHPYMGAHKAEISLLTYFCKIRFILITHVLNFLVMEIQKYL